MIDLDEIWETDTTHDTLLSKCKTDSKKSENKMAAAAILNSLKSPFIYCLLFIVKNGKGQLTAANMPPAK